jgi:hypothetical protein
MSSHRSPLTAHRPRLTVHAEIPLTGQASPEWVDFDRAPTQGTSQAAPKPSRAAYAALGLLMPDRARDR